MFSIRNLNKSYNIKILDNLSYEFYEGKLYVIKGSNGSGKSTLFKIISNIISKDSGEFDDKRISFLPDKFIIPNMIMASSFLDDIIDIDAKEVMKKYNLIDKLAGNLSKGNKQKLGLITTIYTDADIYIFDEGIDGLDDYTKKIFFNDLNSLLNKNKIIILSLHEEINLDFLNPVYLYLKDGKLYEKKD